MNRFLINYAWDILDLGEANHVDNGVARDMFVENLNTFGTDAYPGYPGAEVDYAALSAAWKAMSQSEQAAAKTACRDFMTDCYEEISETRRVGSMAKFYDIAAHYQAPPEEAKPTDLLYTHAWDIWDKADAEKQAENEWFTWAVAPCDKGLQYARLTGDRALFEAVLAGR